MKTNIKEKLENAIRGAEEQMELLYGKIVQADREFSRLTSRENDDKKADDLLSNLDK